MSPFQQFAWTVQAVDQIGGDNQVVAGMEWFQVAGIALNKVDLEADRFQPKIGQAALVIGDELTFVSQGVAQVSPSRQLHSGTDETCREVDAGDLVEVASQFEGGEGGCAAQIERCSRRALTHRGNRPFGQRTREIGDAKVLVAVVEFGVFGEPAVNFVMRWARRQGLANNVVESGVLQEVVAEGVARGVACFVAAGNPRTAFDQVVPVIQGRGGEVVVNRVHGKAVERVGRRLGPVLDISDHVVERAVREGANRAGRGLVIEVVLAGAGVSSASSLRSFTASSRYHSSSLSSRTF